MGAYLYRAVDRRGKNTKGVVEAANAAGARKQLRDRAMVPLSVEATAPGRTAGPAARTRIGARAQVLLTRQLATLIGSGVRIDDALRTVADQSRQARVVSLCLDLRAAVMDGQSLASALDGYPGVFDQFYRASVRAGEGSGTLGQVMDHLADHVEKRAENRQTVQLALLYPVLLAVVSLGVIVALLTFVVPDIVRVFSARGAELPMLTRLLIGGSESLGTYGPALALGAAVAVASGVALLRSPARRRGWHRALTAAPGIGGVVRQIAAAQYASTLATLVVSRVPLYDALIAAAATVGNLHVRERAERAAIRVREGAPLARSLREAEVFPPLLIAMVASGESSGTLGESLTRAATQQNRSIAATVATIVGLVEPAVLLVMGGIVMLLVLAILMPIMGLNQLAV